MVQPSGLAAVHLEVIRKDPAARSDQPLDPTAAGVQCGHATQGAAPPSQGRPLHSSSGSNAPSKGPQRIHHIPGVQTAKPKWRRAPQAGRPLRDGPRGQGTKPPQADAPSTGPRCIKATPRQTDAAGHHSHMRAQRHPVLISSNRGPATRFRDDGKTARQLRGGRTNRYGDVCLSVGLPACLPA